MKVYDVTLSRDGRWWVVSIPEINGLTQAHSVKEARGMAREYIAVTEDIPQDSFDIRVTAATVGTVEHLSRILDDIRLERTRGEQIERAANERSRRLAKQLAAEKVTLRDIGELMGVSYQRVHQLVST